MIVRRAVQFNRRGRTGGRDCCLRAACGCERGQRCIPQPTVKSAVIVIIAAVGVESPHRTRMSDLHELRKWLSKPVEAGTACGRTSSLRIRCRNLRTQQAIQGEQQSHHDGHTAQLE